MRIYAILTLIRSSSSIPPIIFIADTSNVQISIAINEKAFTVVGHSPAPALPRSLAPHLAELCVLHLDRAIVVLPIVVLIALLVLAAGVAVAAALHARIVLHAPNACHQVALVVVGHRPTLALVAPAHTAQVLASVSVTAKKERTLLNA